MQIELDTRIEQYRDGFVARASFQARVHAERRLRAVADELGVPSTNVIRHGKLAVYELVRSHGIDTPVEHGRWDDPAAIVWADLPDLVVVKSAFSSTSRGVFPLRRTDVGWQVVGDTEVLTEDELVGRFSDLTDRGQARPPWFAEEFLDEDGTGSRLPTDVKAYAFYGEIPMVVLRRPGLLGEHPSLTPFRIVDPHGHDLTAFETGSLVDPSLPVPDRLREAVDAAERLSLALCVPFSRMDFYCIGDRVVFGEVTPRPGGSAWHGEIVDRMLGDAWDRAQVRVTRDISAR